MGRRLAEATKACRTRRTRGEIGLRFFFVLAEAAVVFRLAGARFAALLLAGVLSTGVEDWDWATAGGKPSQGREKIPTRAATAKRRTQTLPTAESWHP